MLLPRCPTLETLESAPRPSASSIAHDPDGAAGRYRADRHGVVRRRDVDGRRDRRGAARCRRPRPVRGEARRPRRHAAGHVADGRGARRDEPEVFQLARGLAFAVTVREASPEHHCEEVADAGRPHRGRARLCRSPSPCGAVSAAGSTTSASSRSPTACCQEQPDLRRGARRSCASTSSSAPTSSAASGAGRCRRGRPPPPRALRRLGLPRRAGRRRDPDRRPHRRRRRRLVGHHGPAVPTRRRSSRSGPSSSCGRAPVAASIPPWSPRWPRSSPRRPRSHLPARSSSSGGASFRSCVTVTAR